MEVILTQDVSNIGKTGVVVKVKDGYARNFLFPHKLAVPVTEANLKNLELAKQKKDAEAEQAKKDAVTLQSRLAGLSLTIAAQVNENEELYGSISAHEIAGVLKDEGFEIAKDAILLDERITKLGIYEVNLKLHPEVLAKIKLWIVKK
jgi:large subunit ribosomal protein L9